MHLKAGIKTHFPYKPMDCLIFSLNFIQTKIYTNRIMYSRHYNEPICLIKMMAINDQSPLFLTFIPLFLE